MIGGTIGGVTGYFSSPKEIDPLLYQGMIDKYTKGRRFQARTAANQLSADLGASLAARNLNQSKLGAGVITGNRGRIMAAAEQDISKFQADIYQRIAQAEFNAEQAENEAVRQGWINLAQQLAVTAADIGADYAAKQATETGEQRLVEAGALARDYTEEIAGTQRDAQHILDNVPDIPERKTGQALPGSTAEATGASPSGVKVDPIRIDSPSVRELRERLDDESLTLLGTMMPGYEQDIAEMDELLKEEAGTDIINITPSPDRVEAGGTAAPVIAESHELIDQPANTNPFPVTGEFGGREPREVTGMTESSPGRIAREDAQEDAADPNPEWTWERPDVPPVRDGAIRIEGDPESYEHEIIVNTFGIDDARVSPESYQGLPSYYPLILDAEGGYNPSDPSMAGVWQGAYNDFLNSVENASAYPRNVRDLSPSNIRDFYQWYHEKTVASVNSQYTPDSVKELFNSSQAFQLSLIHI